MQFRLNIPHYIDDRILEAGTVIGDGTPIPFRYMKEVRDLDVNGRPVLKDGKPVIHLPGSAMSPSREMTPIDDEAKALFEDTFHGNVPPSDPTASIPIRGTGDEARAPGPAAPRPSAVAPQPPPRPSATPATGMHAKAEPDKK